MKKITNNRLLMIIITVYLSGIVCSFIFITPDAIKINQSNVNLWGIIQTFCLNFWYILIIWFFGLSIFGYLFNTFIVFFRGFIYGNLIVHLIRINFGYLSLISLVELLIFLPTFLYLSYQSIMLSYSKGSSNRFNLENYYKLLYIVTIVIFIYSIILEIIGGIYG